MATTETKSPMKSVTVWFGIASVVLGTLISLLALLGQQNIINLDAGIWATVSGILTIALRFKTKIAVALKVDDPTTPEDESQGETPVEKKEPTEKGFAMTRVLVVLAALSFVPVALTGCAHLDPAEQEAVEASMTCSIELLTAAKTCLPECLAIEDPTAEKQCVIDCTLETAEDVLPTCALVYGDIHSPQLGIAVRNAVESAFMIYNAVKK